MYSVRGISECFLLTCYCRVCPNCADGSYTVDFNSCEGRESLGHSFLETPQTYPRNLSEDFFAHIVSAGTFSHNLPEGTAFPVVNQLPDFRNNDGGANSGVSWPESMTETSSVSDS